MILYIDKFLQHQNDYCKESTIKLYFCQRVPWKAIFIKNICHNSMPIILHENFHSSFFKLKSNYITPSSMEKVHLIKQTSDRNIKHIMYNIFTLISAITVVNKQPISRNSYIIKAVMLFSSALILNYKSNNVWYRGGLCVYILILNQKYELCKRKFKFHSGRE